MPYEEIINISTSKFSEISNEWSLCSLFKNHFFLLLFF